MAVNDPQQIAKLFCDFFSEVGPKLARDIPTPNNDFMTHLLVDPRPNNASIYLSSTDPEEIYKITMNMQPKKVVGMTE